MTNHRYTTHLYDSRVIGDEMDDSHGVVPTKRKNDIIDEFISKYLIKKYQ